MDSDQAYNSSTGCNLPIRELTLPKKGWECEICGFQSAFKTSLINHQAVHSDARPFECPICDYAAKRKYDLKKHVQLKHGRDESSLSLSKVDYASQADGLYGAVVSSSGRPNNDSSMSPQHISDHLRMGTNEVLNLIFDQSSPKITVPRYVASPEKQKQLRHLDIKSEPCEREDEEEDATLGVSFQEAWSTPHREALAIGRETYSINARERLTKSRHAAIMEARLHDASPTRPHSCTQTDDHPRRRHHVDVSCADSDSARYAHQSHIGSSFQRENLSLRHSLLSVDLDTEGSHQHRKRSRQFSSQADDPSSSMSCQSETPTHSEVSCSSVKIDKQCETKKTFSCPHCDILYFDHALYLMHMGLHSNGNPWRCAVCGGDFWEKYSFSSHFINLHSQVTSGE